MKRHVFNEGGAVLVIIALLGTLLIMFVAMAIDLSMAANARQAAEQYSRLAALAAVEGYFSADPNLTELQKRQFAVQRAQSIASHNAVINNQAIGSSFSHEMVLHDDDPSADTEEVTKVEAGRWYYKMPMDPAEAAKVHCTPPCFQRLGTDESANAMKIVGTMYTSVTSNFAQAAVGATSSESRVSSVGGVTPRHGCFLIDLSPSIVNETHFVRSARDQVNTPQDGFGSMFGFFRAKDNDPTGYIYEMRDILPENPPIPDDYYADYPSDSYCTSARNGKPFQRDECAYATLRDRFPDRSTGREVNPNRDIDAPATPEAGYKRHFASDYRKMKMLSDADYALHNHFLGHHPNPFRDASYSVPDQLWTTIDVSRRVDLGGTRTDGYGGPEPLTSVMAGLRTAIERFRSKRVYGDKLCLIFYDQRLQWTRIVKLTDDFDYLLSFTDFQNVQALHQDCADNDTDNAACSVTSGQLASATGFERAVRHGLFPSSNSFTDTLAAMAEGEKQLAEGAEAGVPSSDFVVLIGDGLANCPADETCNNRYRSYARTMAQLKALVQTHFKPRNVYVHAMLVGSHVAPHTVKLLNPETDKCYTDVEARAGRMEMLDPITGEVVRDPVTGEIQYSGVPWVMGGTADNQPITSDAQGQELWENASSGAGTLAPFYQVNADIFDLVRATRGVWAPIRIPPSDVPCEVLEDSDCTTTPRRLETDPQCRTPAQQITAFMDDIIGRHPYAIVGRE